MEVKCLAFDLGASSGRAMLGAYDGNSVKLEEIHRFTNEPVCANGTLYWDVLGLYREIQTGLKKACSAGEVASLGVDTWGVDFVPLDENGSLLSNPVHYRDKRTKGQLEKAFTRIAADRLFQATGTQEMEINTVFQIAALKEKQPDLFAGTKQILLMPDYFNYLLSGQAKAEKSIASTTQMLATDGQGWSEDVLSAFEIPAGIMGDIVPAGTVLGPLTTAVKDELNITCQPQVIAVAGHDTQSAMLAVPSQEEQFIFLSCGTWSLLGTEISAPLLTEEARLAGFTNEAAAGGKTALLSNLTGLWLVQECRRAWMRQGKEYSFAELEELAKQAKALQAFVHPEAEEFMAPGDMPGRVQDYCRRTGQTVPQSAGEIVRCLYESLALQYRSTVDKLEHCVPDLTGAPINMVGGGIQSYLLCQMTADACNRKVKTGPVEATVLGNLLAQLWAQGVFKNMTEVRQAAERSASIANYQPLQPGPWEQAYQKWEALPC